MRITDFERDPHRIERSTERPSESLEKCLRNFWPITGSSEARHMRALRNSISIRLVQLCARTRSSLSPHATRRSYNVTQPRATGGRLRVRPRDNARVDATALTRGFVLYELGSVDNIRRSRRANQSMTLARNYRPVFRKNCKARPLISICAVIR